MPSFVLHASERRMLNDAETQLRNALANLRNVKRSLERRDCSTQGAKCREKLIHSATRTVDSINLILEITK